MSGSSSSRTPARPKTLANLDAELTTEQAAAILGFTRAQMYRRIGDGTLPHHRVGKTVRFWKADLLRLMEGDAAPRVPAPLNLLELLLGDQEEVTFEVTIKRKELSK